MRHTASAVAMKVLAGRITSSAWPHVHRAQRQLEGVGAVGDADAVLDADQGGVLTLEVSDLLTTDEGCSGEDVVEA